jgi:hypothetical protein
MGASWGVVVGLELGAGESSRVFSMIVEEVEGAGDVPGCVNGVVRVSPLVGGIEGAGGGYEYAGLGEGL